MEQTTPSRLSSSARHATARAAADWLAARMRDRGYALPPEGRGGVRRLAERAGVSPSVVSTLLRGENPNPSPESLRLIATALGLPFPELLIRFGVVTPDELRAVQDGDTIGRPPITIETAAAGLDIDPNDPVGMQMFEAAVSAVRDLQRKRLDRERAE